jgi:hypothetical protein
MPLLVDVDMGLDDARVLLALTRQHRYRVEAVITVEGSAGARRGAENALRLLAAAGAHEVPVAVGAEQALSGPIPAPPWRALTESLGGLQLPPARRRTEAGSGAELLRQLDDALAVGILDDRHHQADLHLDIIDRHRFSAGAGGLPSHVDDIRAFRYHAVRLFHRSARVRPDAVPGKRVRAKVYDTHDIGFLTPAEHGITGAGRKQVGLH